MKTTRNQSFNNPTASSADQVQSPGSMPKNRVLVWLKRIGMVLVIGIVVIAALGAAYQAIATADDRRSFPAPGQMVGVGGYRLHLYCTGANINNSPTVILETGLGAISSSWAWVQPEVAKATRVCAYDRAGTGWSDASPNARDAQHIATELHTLLRNANIQGPYVLAGWSFGGLYNRSYAEQYPEDVAGIVLVDSSSPDQCNSTPGGQSQCASNARIYSIAPVLVRVGVMRVMGLFQPDSGLPDQQNKELRASFSATKDWDAQSAEFLAGPITNTQGTQTKALGAIPLFVLTATDHGTPPDQEQLWQGWQAGFTGLSTNSVQRVVPGASHGSLIFDETDSKETTDAILQVIEASRTGQPLTSTP